MNAAHLAQPAVGRCDGSSSHCRSRWPCSARSPPPHRWRPVRPCPASPRHRAARRRRPPRHGGEPDRRPDRRLHCHHTGAGVGHVGARAAPRGLRRCADQALSRALPAARPGRHTARLDARRWCHRDDRALPGDHRDALGGRGGFYANWLNFGKGGPPMWETYHIDQLIPFIDANLRTIPKRQGRAIAGLSMGGFGAMCTRPGTPTCSCRRPRSPGRSTSLIPLPRSWSTCRPARTVATRPGVRHLRGGPQPVVRP